MSFSSGQNGTFREGGKKALSATVSWYVRVVPKFSYEEGEGLT